jgi:O-antigen ligase
MAMEQGSRFGNVLALAELGGTVALIAAMIVPWRQRSLFTVIRIAAFVIGLGLAIGSGSRGQVLATVVAGILFYPLARRINNLRSFFLTAFGLMTLAVVVYVTFLLFIGYQNRTRWDIGFMLRDIGGRFDMCWAFMQAWYASPAHWLFGLGTNAWITVSGDSGIHGNYVHNIAIEVLCEHGLVGGAIFAATTVLVCIGGLKMWRMHRDNPPLRSAAAILLAISAFSLFNSLKAGNITSMMPFYFWLVLAKIAKREEIMAAEQDADFAGDSLEPESGYEELPEYALAR